jgi:hypothetical protein
LAKKNAGVLSSGIVSRTIGFERLALAAARPAEERNDRGGEVVHTRRNRVTAVVALGVVLVRLMTAVRAFDHVVMVVVLAHWNSLDLEWARGRDHVFIPLSKGRREFFPRGLALFDSRSRAVRGTN